MTRDVPALRRHGELHDGLESMSSTELLAATRRALSTIYTPQQAAIWLELHASDGPVAVARKALRLCSIDVAVEMAATGTADRGQAPPQDVTPTEIGRRAEQPATSVEIAGLERDAFEVQRVVTTAVRTLFACRDPRELHEVVLEVVGRLGGHILQAGDTTAEAIDVSLGRGTPLLVVPDPQRHDRAKHLRAHLPQLLDDARRALRCLEQAKQLAVATERDSLTGLPNRRAYERLTGRVLPGDVLVLVDLDGFKQLNHTHGHLAGDQVLRIFAAVLQAQLCASEQALRLGSDEFLIVLNQPGPDATTFLLERLRTAWKQRRPLPVTFSTGIAAVTSTIDAALQAADEHLHQPEHARPGPGPTSHGDLERTPAELDQSRALQRVAGAVARLGGWSLDLATNQAQWSEEIFEILDYPPDAEVAVEEALELFLPADRGRLVAALKACADAGTPFDLDLRLETRLGRWQWARVIGEARYGPQGAVSHVTGALQDITAQKESEAQIRKLAERLTTTLESITDAFFTLDRDWRMTYVNHRAEQVLCRSRDELLGQDLWAAFPRAVGSVLEEASHRAMSTGISEVVENFHWEPLDIWLSIHVYPSEQGLAVYFGDVSDEHHDQQALRRLNKELNEANRQLEGVAQLKEDLLSMASHELRTPLTPILGFLGILQTRGDLTADQKQMLERIDASAKRMLRLVDDLLVVGRASAGALISHPQDVSVETALLEVIDELGEVGVPVDLAVGGCRAFVDPQHLEQIAVNLLTNATKYGTPPIVVTAKPAGPGRIALEVADHGAGVPPDFQEHMWDRFAHKDRSDPRTVTGVGLGLSIVKLLAAANHGTVSYRDGRPTGAVFTIDLPGTCPRAGAMQSATCEPLADYGTDGR